LGNQLFSNTTYPINLLVEKIETGELGLPDLQRPFVWKRWKVRDLFDSLYRGYPVGNLLFWVPPSDVAGQGIGAGNASGIPQKMIVDGQQRLTSLYAVMKGREIVTEDNETQLIRIAFNPLTEEFKVADAATDADPEWLSSISEVWTTNKGTWVFTNQFIDKLSASRDVSDEEKQRIGESLSKLQSLFGYQFSALELASELDIQVVAEVFQRINSTGVELNSADFILTLMSVYWKEGRHQLEDFCRLAKKPSTGIPSPYNHFHQPSPDQMLRVAVGLALKRGVLQTAYQVLRGRNLDSGVVSSELRQKRFDDLSKAQQKVLNLNNWHEYMVAVKKAGFRSGSMLTSKNNFLYGYLIFLIGKTEYGVGANELRDVMARWFFMSSLTGRYTGSPETILEADLRRISEAKSADEFTTLLDAIVDNQLTSDFWSVNLPDYLDSSASWSPYLYAYHAALILLEARALFSKVKIRDLLEPGVITPKSPVERHHLFPKAYLSSIGITGTTRTNHIANFAFVEWKDNVNISGSNPADYFPQLFGQLTTAEQEAAAFHHALPPGWERMEYPEFLIERRKMIARVVEAGFKTLQHSPVDPTAPKPPPSVAELLRQMETSRVEFKRSARVADESNIPEKVIISEVIKTVAAFLNSQGGTLGIGISDDGDVLGIQADLDVKHQDLDKYQNWLTTVLIHAIGSHQVAAYVDVRFESFGGVVVCLVDVKPSREPAYASSAKGENVFFVRAGNSSRVLAGSEMYSYIKQRFGSWK
jgi:hypothetical protein